MDFIETLILVEVQREQKIKKQARHNGAHLLSQYLGGGEAESSRPILATQCDSVSNKQSRNKEERINWEGDIYNENTTCECENDAVVWMDKQVSFINEWLEQQSTPAKGRT